MKAIAITIFSVLGVAVASAIVIARETGTTPLGNSDMPYDLWIRLTLTDPVYVVILAAVVAVGWIVAELRSSKTALRIVCGVAAIALIGLFHVLVSGRLRAEITMHQYALRNIDGHIESDDTEEVSRAIKIHDEELEATGDSFLAAEALLHELGRMWN